MAKGTQPSRGWRIALSATLALAMGIGPFALFALSALGPLVVNALDLSRADFGSVATVAFAVAAVTSLLSGRQVDVVGGRIALFWVFVSGGCAAAVVATAPSLAWLWVGATLSGVGQGIASPVTNKVVAERIPSGRQGLQIGVKQSGVSVGQAVAGLTLPGLAVVVGWRASVLMGAMIAMVGMLLVVSVVPPTKAPVRMTRVHKAPPVDTSVRLLAFYTFAVGLLTPTVVLYAPLYAYERLGLTPAIAGLGTGILGIMGIPSRIVWSQVAEKLILPSKTLVVIAFLTLVSVNFLLFSEHLGSLALWTGLIGFGSSAMAASTVVMLTVVQRVGNADTGRVSGVVGLGLFSGFMLGPLLFGTIVDSAESYTLGWSAMVFISLLGFLISVHLNRRMGQIDN